ncbi:alpha-L-rhamnosidase-related protein [Actinomadura madurae]|uniref:alpha-L-rhamnosidase-related protein n=1 Tax=Actinomadura madurae TaxID=1993 RepID=UPI0020D2433B|nr:hypothetical protein [Actinomadura madurae]MCP9977857.1 hypothetical protein [Actinomadura madurae]
MHSSVSRRRRGVAAVALGVSALVAAQAAPPGTAQAEHGRGPAPWERYNLSPSSRTLHPVSVFKTSGTVDDADAVLKGRVTRLSGAGSSVTLDFGKEVSGLPTLHFAGSDGPRKVGVAFSESSTYVDTTSDASTGGPRSRDGALSVDVDGATSYTAPAAQLRGGFRYLTVFLESDGRVDLDKVSLYYTPAPTMKDPSKYANYFYSSDDLLNRIWYAGAYTVQLNTISPRTGRIWEPPAALWDNTGVIGVGDTILVDGAKRDRTVWPGDLGIEIPSAYAAFGDTESARNALTTVYQHQRDTGELPYAGPELDRFGSDTYHLWTLAASWDYYRYTGDARWLAGVWDRYKKGVDFITGKMDDKGLVSITGTSDSVRILAKGENLTANVLMWHVLDTGSRLARTQGDRALAASYAERAAALRTAVDANFWDETARRVQVLPGLHDPPAGRQLPRGLVRPGRPGHGPPHQQLPQGQLERDHLHRPREQGQPGRLLRIDGGERPLRRGRPGRRPGRRGHHPPPVGLHAESPGRDRKHLLGVVPQPRGRVRLLQLLREPRARLGDRSDTRSHLLRPRPEPHRVGRTVVRLRPAPGRPHVRQGPHHDDGRRGQRVLEGLQRRLHRAAEGSRPGGRPRRSARLRRPDQGPRRRPPRLGRRPRPHERRAHRRRIRVHRGSARLAHPTEQPHMTPVSEGGSTGA